MEVSKIIIKENMISSSYIERIDSYLVDLKIRILMAGRL
jgi:hypothetical protein